MFRIWPPAETRMAESATVDGGVDRVMYWPIVLAVAWSAVLIFVARGPEAWSSLGLFVLYLLWPLSTLAAFIAALVWLRDGSWRRMWSALVLPLATFVVYLNGDLVAQAAVRLVGNLQLVIALASN
jgi:hypothetical protein